MPVRKLCIIELDANCRQIGAARAQHALTISALYYATGRLSTLHSAFATDLLALPIFELDISDHRFSIAVQLFAYLKYLYEIAASRHEVPYDALGSTRRARRCRRFFLQTAWSKAGTDNMGYARRRSSLSVYSVRRCHGLFRCNKSCR